MNTMFVTNVVSIALAVSVVVADAGIYWLAVVQPTLP